MPRPALVTLAHGVQVIVDNYRQELQGKASQLSSAGLVKVMELIANLVGQLK